MGHTANTVYFILVALAWVVILFYTVRAWRKRSYQGEGVDIIWHGILSALGFAFVLFFTFISVLAGSR